MNQQVYKHPEWKRLYDALADTVAEGELYTYEALTELMSLDATTRRGRSQFLRFAKEVLTTRQFHFENVLKIGYRVVRPNEHGTCAHRQVARARRRLRKGRLIAVNTQIDKLSDDERRANTDLVVRIAGLEKAVSEQGRAIKQLASGKTPERLPPPFFVPSGNKKLG